MSKGKKKKPKYAAGAVLGQLGGVRPAATPQRPMDEQSLYTHEDKARNTMAGIPIIGGLTNAVMGISGGIRGEGTSVASNFAASLVSPTSGARAAKDAGLGNMGAIQAFVNPVAGAILTARARKKQMAELEMQRQGKINQGLIANSAVPNQTFRKGGKLDIGQNVVQGGALESISEDAVEVKANDPTRTDSVELDTAFVDNNEIIDNKNRVFSDDLLGPSGKSIAKEAKKLEKMKNDSPRFADSNARIDSKLDQLFNYQESMKKPTAKAGKPAFAGGGKKPSEIMYMNGDTQAIGQDTQNAMAYQGWQNFNTRMNTQLQTPVNTTPPAMAAKKGGFDWQGATAIGAAVAPNLANAFLQRGLKGPRAPQLETDIRMNRISADPELAAADRAYNNAKQVLTTNTAQGSNLTAGVGSLLSKKLAAQNQTFGQVNNINTMIGNQEITTNQGIRARNAERSNQYNQNQVDFANRKLMMTSDNIANASNKVQGYLRERNQMKRDRQAYEFMTAAYGDSGVLQRLQVEHPELYADLYKSMAKKGNSKGGLIPKLSKKKMC